MSRFGWSAESKCTIIVSHLPLAPARDPLSPLRSWKSCRKLQPPAQPMLHPLFVCSGAPVCPLPRQLPKLAPPVSLSPRPRTCTSPAYSLHTFVFLVIRLSRLVQYSTAIDRPTSTSTRRTGRSDVLVSTASSTNTFVWLKLRGARFVDILFIGSWIPVGDWRLITRIDHFFSRS